MNCYVPDMGATSMCDGLWHELSGDPPKQLQVITSSIAEGCDPLRSPASSDQYTYSFFFNIRMDGYELSLFLKPVSFRHKDCNLCECLAAPDVGKYRHFITQIMLFGCPLSSLRVTCCSRISPAERSSIMVWYEGVNSDSNLWCQPAEHFW